MRSVLRSIRRFLSELRRRNVYRVALAYLAAGFIVVELADIAAGTFNLPGWFGPMVWIVVGLGFPIAIVLAWALEVTPEGVRVEESEASEEAPVPSSGPRDLWVGASVLALVLLGAWWLWSDVGGRKSGTEPGATTDTTATQVASAAQDTSDRPRIAVLPFENIARDSADAFFAKGMHEEVLNQLSKVSGLEVISRTSVMRYADSDKPISQISEELGGVSALLEGTVRRAGDRVRITTQLIGAPEDEHLWSSTYEREVSPEAIFDIQADIAEQIAGALETQLAGGERRRIQAAPTSDLVAYEAFLRGRGQVWQFWGRWTPELLDRASRNLHEAARRDSSFAQAHAMLGHVHLGRIWNRLTAEAPRWLDSATAAVERARRIDPDLAAVRFAQARIYRFQGSLDAEAEALRRVLKRQPSHARAKASLARNLGRRGQHAEAVRVAREAVRLDPRRPAVLAGMGDRLGDVRLYDAAEAWYRHTLEIEPGYTAAYAGRAFSELEQGRPEQALAVWQDFFEEVEDPPPVSFFFATMAALTAGRPEQAQRYIRRDPNHLTAESDLSVGWSDSLDSGTLPPGMAIQDGFIELGLGHDERGRRFLREAVDAIQGETHRGERLARPYGVWLAGALATLGRTEEALREVERVAEEGPGRTWLTWYAPLDTLRSNPRFQEIVGEIEARREEAREKLRRMDLDLYPPGAQPDPKHSRPQADA